MGPLVVTPAQQEVVEAVKTVRDGGASFFAYPAEAWLYLVAGTENPTKYALLLPGYNTEAQVTDVIRSLEAQRTPYLVFNFSVSPTDPIFKYQEDHYEEVARPGFYILFKRLSGR